MDSIPVIFSPSFHRPRGDPLDHLENPQILAACFFRCFSPDTSTASAPTHRAHRCRLLAPLRIGADAGATPLCSTLRCPGRPPLPIAAAPPSPSLHGGGSPPSQRGGGPSIVLAATAAGPPPPRADLRPHGCAWLHIPNQWRMLLPTTSWLALRPRPHLA
jgi:hypothetical protein